jgi:hypothetical protein
MSRREQEREQAAADAATAAILDGLRRRPELYDAFAEQLSAGDALEIGKALQRHWSRRQRRGGGAR